MGFTPSRELDENVLLLLCLDDRPHFLDQLVENDDNGSGRGA
jgi:hypothetical protein